MLPVSWDTIRLTLHVLAATIWVGGQLTVAAMVPALRRAGPDLPRAVARQFSRVAWPAFAILVLTGMENVAAARTHDHGRYQTTLIVKIAVVLVSGAAALLHARACRPAALAVFGALSRPRPRWPRCFPACCWRADMLPSPGIWLSYPAADGQPGEACLPRGSGDNTVRRVCRRPSPAQGDATRTAGTKSFPRSGLDGNHRAEDPRFPGGAFGTLGYWTARIRRPVLSRGVSRMRRSRCPPAHGSMPSRLAPSSPAGSVITAASPLARTLQPSARASSMWSTLNDTRGCRAAAARLPDSLVRNTMSSPSMR